MLSGSNLFHNIVHMVQNINNIKCNYKQTKSQICRPVIKENHLRLIYERIRITPQTFYSYQNTYKIIV